MVAHGVEPVAGPGRVEVRASRSGASLRLEVRDTGPGPLAARAGSGSGVGLRNTRARLAHLYGAAQRLELAQVPGGGTLVSIEIPWHGVATAGGTA